MIKNARGRWCSMWMEDRAAAVVCRNEERKFIAASALATIGMTHPAVLEVQAL